MALTLFFGVFLTSCEKNTPENEMVVGKQLVKSLVTLENETVDKQLIRSLKEFDEAITSKNEVLHKLTPETLELFREELVFNKQGELGGARFHEVRKELSKEDYLRLWFLFDVDKEEIKTLIKEQDYNENYKSDYFRFYKCANNYSCSFNPLYICLSGCH